MLVRVSTTSSDRDALRPATPSRRPRVEGSTPPMAAWTVRLLGAVEADNGDVVVSTFATRAVAQLLARLAMYPERAHPREELIELLWPGVDLSVGRNRLRQALSALKTVLERRHDTGRTVIEADRMSVRAAPGAIECDVHMLDRLLSSGRPEGARALYRGEFMPGHYEDWVVEERRRVETLHDQLPAGLSATPPRVKPMGLPHYWTQAFGIEANVSRLADVVRQHRLVTVHGAGGAGKTRLATALATALGAQAPADHAGAPAFDSIVFVSLVDCRDAEQARSAIGSALNLGTSVALQRALEGRRPLLILDNCEQLEGSATALFAELLSDLPELHLLLTSRCLCDVDGEVVFDLPGLPLPPAMTSQDGSAVVDAVALFIDRARSAQPAFAPDRRAHADIAALVHWLGGNPLAIELAASRMRTMSPRELLERLRAPTGSPMLDQLARRTGDGSASVRHASIREVMDWSWKQLDRAEAAMLRSASALPGAARLETLAAVAGVETLEAERLIDGLRIANLVTCHEDSDGRRYALLQPVREFAAERAGADEARQARGRLRRWLLAFTGSQVARDTAALRQESGLINAALVTAAGDGAHDDAAALAFALRPYWDSFPMPPTVLSALEAALRHIEAPATRGDLHTLLAFGYCGQGHAKTGLDHARKALALADNDHRRTDALGQILVSRMVIGLDREGLDADAARAETLARECGNIRALAGILRIRAHHACDIRNQFDVAERQLTESQALCERLGSARLSNLRRMERAMLVRRHAGLELSLAMMKEGLRTATAMGDHLNAFYGCFQYGRLLLIDRRFDDAARTFREGVRLAWEHHLTHVMSKAMLNLPEALVMLGQAEAAARLQGYALREHERAFGSLNNILAREVKRGRRMIRLHLGAERAESLRLEGIGMSLTQAVALALGDDPRPVESADAGRARSTGAGSSALQAANG